jgi:hypothetical protein
MKEAFRRVDEWLFEPGDPRRLAALRVGLSSILLVRLCRGVYGQWASEPDALYRPISFMHLVPDLPPHAVVVAIQIAAIAAACCAIVGLRTRLSLALAWLGSVFLIGMVASFGRDGQNETMMLLAAVPLLASGCGDRWSLDALLGRRSGKKPVGPSARYGWPVRTSMVVVAGGYWFAGVAKLVWSGPSWILGNNLQWILYTASDAQRVPNTLGLFIANHAVVAHLMAGAALATELLFPVVLWRPRAAWVFVPAVITLHTAIWLTLGLDYFAWGATALVVFVDWVWLVARARRLLEPPLPPSSFGSIRQPQPLS